ncbi:TULIP family P47-like protein [uncultured Roseobacter sp.]|uniref:TULIP family P47-like protein n=1 Tax=uncultured Roseobacter sp. TaxID=114847 RepID=UPI00261207B1|nr:TULIP family P47-like protein [uncultured Roseobacter sp.]
MNDMSPMDLSGDALREYALCDDAVHAFTFPEHQQKFDLELHVLAAEADCAPTFGWDTAFAIRFPDANAAIIRQHSSPASFQMTAPDNSCSASGSFGDWQLTGGDGVDLHMSIPVTAGTLVYNGKKYDIAGVTAIVEVQLNYLPPPPLKRQSPSPPPSTHDLKIKQKARGPVKVVSVLSITAPAGLGFMQKSMAGGLLGLWLNANLDEFDHTFNAVTLNRIIDNASFKWLAPTTTGYACVKGCTSQDSILAVLCMTEGRGTATLTGQITPNAIPNGSHAGFLIAQERFLEKMVLPSLPGVFKGSRRTDFKMSDDKLSIINTARIKTKTVSNAGTTYQPEITTLNISVVGDEIVVHTETETDIGLGSVSEVTVTSFQNLILADKPDGTQTLSYKQSRGPIKDNSTKTNASGEAQKIIIEIAAAILVAILTAITDGAFLIVGLIILALLMGLLKAIPKQISDIVGKKISNNSPSMALLISNSTDPIVWQGSKAFRLTEAGLAGSVRLGGNLGFA